MFDWARQLDDVAWAKALSGEDRRAPPPPTETLQAMFVGSSGQTAYGDSRIFWQLTKQYLAPASGQSPNKIKILDIGVGWGRNYRWMLRDVPSANMLGVDIDSKMIDLCREAMPYGNFETVKPGAAYPHLETPYDLAIAFSVFSHLSETMAYEVLRSAHDALRSGGIFALTTLRPAHIDVWARQTETEPFATILKANGFHRLEWWERATEGQHLYVGTGGGDDSRPADQYGEAVVVRNWFERVAGFKLIAYERRDDFPQSYVVLQRL